MGPADSGRSVLTPELAELGTRVLDAAFAIHREVGPGCLEGVYSAFLADEIRDAGMEVATDVHLPVERRGRLVSHGLRLDLLVERAVIVEVKAVHKVLPVHRAQVITYLRLTGCPLGYLINFNLPLLKDGIHRLLRPRRPSGARARTDLL